MKKGILGLFAVVGLSLTIYSANLKLAWDHDELDTLSKFRIYISEVSGNYGTNFVEVAAPQLETTITTLRGSTQYYFIAKAVDLAGLESGPSNEITHKTSVNPPYNLRIVIEP